MEKRKRGEENKETPEKQGKQTIRTNKEKCYICSKAMEIGTVGWKIEARNNKKRGSFSYQRWIHIECWNGKEKEEAIKNTPRTRDGGNGRTLRDTEMMENTYKETKTNGKRKIREEGEEITEGGEKGKTQGENDKKERKTTGM